MSHPIRGFIRNEDGVPLNNVPVTLYYQSTNTIVTDVGVSANPTHSDSTGFFQFTCELNPGPIYVKADLDGGTTLRYRYGSETMQAGGWFLADFPPTLLGVAGDGLLGDKASNFTATMSGSSRKLTLGAGVALQAGVLFSLDTPRDFIIAANTTLAERVDTVVLTTIIDQTSNLYGQQLISVIAGTVTGVAPTITSTNTIVFMPLFNLSTVLNATVSTMKLDRRVYAQPQRWNTGSIPVTTIDPAGLATSVSAAIATASPTDMLSTAATGASQFLRRPIGTGSAAPTWSTLNLSTLANVLETTTANAGDLLAFNGTSWEALTNDGILTATALLDGTTIGSSSTIGTISPNPLDVTLTWPAAAVGRTYDIIILGSLAFRKSVGTGRCAAFLTYDNGAGGTTNANAVGNTRNTFGSPLLVGLVAGYIPTSSGSNSVFHFSIALSNQGTPTQTVEFGEARVLAVAIPRG